MRLSFGQEETDEAPLPEGEDDGLGDLAYGKLQIHMLIGIRLLSVYQKHRDEAEQKEAEHNEATFDFEELENIYYSASAFISTAGDWRKPSILS